MTEEEIKIGQIVLNELIENNGQLDERIYFKIFFEKYNLTNNKTINTVIIILIEDYKLIRRGNNNAPLKIITDEGKKAQKKGLKKYLE